MICFTCDICGEYIGAYRGKASFWSKMKVAHATMNKLYARFDIYDEGKLSNGEETHTCTKCRIIYLDKLKEQLVAELANTTTT